MDLQIEGRAAIVCASGGGLGFVCAQALAAEGVKVTLNGRDTARLEEAASRLAASGASVTAVTGDVSLPATWEALLEACPEPDILINNCGGPKPGPFQDQDEDDWSGAVRSNMIAPLMLLKAVLPGMRQRRFGRVVNITSAMVTTPRPHMTLSAGARAGLTAAMKAIALDVARDNVTINNLLPERFDTRRQIEMAEAAAKREGISFEEAREAQVKSIAARRLGDPREFGAACAFLCGSLAGFISGQNLHLDGGSYPALI